MKAFRLLAALLIIAMILPACGEDQVSTGSNMANYSVKKMINQGAADLEDAAYSYTENDVIASGLQALGDYMVFPVNTASGKKFPERMREVYEGDDCVAQNIRMMYKLSQGETDPPVLTAKRFRLRNAGNRRDVIDDVIEFTKDIDTFVKDNPWVKDAVGFIGDIVSEVPVIGGIVKGIGDLLGIGGPSAEDMHAEAMAAMNKISNQVAEVKAELGEFRGEFNDFRSDFNDYRKDFEFFANWTKRSLNKAHLQMDLALKNLHDLKGDLNMSTMALSNMIVEVKNEINFTVLNSINATLNGFIFTYSTTPSYNAMFNTIYNFLYLNSTYWTSVSELVGLLFNMQETAIAKNYYSAKISGDTGFGVPAIKVRISTSDGSTFNTTIDYNNPRATMAIGLGNIDLLSRWFFLYPQAVTILNVTNESMTSHQQACNAFAQNALKILNNEVSGLQGINGGIKQSAALALANLQAEYNAHVAALLNQYPSLTAGKTVVKIEFLNASNQVIASTVSLNTAKMTEFITKHYYQVLISYPVTHISKLIALEVRLKSYL